MEQYWTKKRVLAVLNGDPEALALVLKHYEPVLFTWMYYQVGADANIAADLTARTFVRALEHLRQFEPSEMTLFQWLKEQAKAARDEGLLQWQLKPQRPWAWSQLPDTLLKSLSQLRSEPLGETIADNPFVQEIVQAALAELEQSERELMMHRFSHLETSAHIAAEMRLSFERVNDLLYKCRHSFRRVFFQLISSVNPGFSESNAGAGIEVMDNNLEKLLRATGMYQSPSESQEAMIRERFFDAARETAAEAPAGNRRVWAAAGAVTAVFVVIAAIAVALLRSDTERPAATLPLTAPARLAPKETTTLKPDVPKTQTTQQDIDEEELKMIFQLGQEGNVEALLEILKSGQFTSQLAAAHFVGKVGKPSAIDFLEQAENQWYPNGPKENPFADAISEIARRYPNEVKITDKDDVVPPAPQAAQESVSVQGTVQDFMGKPIAGAKVELYRNPVFSGKVPQPVASAVSGEDGRYAIKQTFEGPFFVDCRYGTKEQSFRQAVRLVKQRAVQCDFGGQAALGGRISIRQQPLNGLRLTLCDTFDPALSAFQAETIIDANGSFSFTGVRQGVYYLFATNDDKTLARLCYTEISQTETLDLNLQPVTVIAEYPDPNALLGGTLAYRVEPASGMEEKIARTAEPGKLLFENVLPGTYVLKARLSQGIVLQQTVEIQAGADEQVLSIEPPAQHGINVRGKAAGSTVFPMLLVSADQRIWIDLKVDADGGYELRDIPADVYSLAAFVRGRLVEFTTLDLTGGTEMLVDLEIEKIVSPFSPLFVVVADSRDHIISGARVWVTGGSDASMAESAGQGAFLAVMAGEYTLHAAHERLGSKSKEIAVKRAPLTSEPTPENTFLMQFEN